MVKFLNHISRIKDDFDCVICGTNGVISDGKTVYPEAVDVDDVDPYVRKTAAICVAKFYDMDPQRCEEEGFILRLRKMINDSSPFVVSNAIFALHDISQTIGRDVIRVNSKMLKRLLVCLDECSEWGQIILLDVLSTYVPQDENEATQIVEHTVPHLQHANNAVILGYFLIISI